jgi:hypothetical protein
MKLLVTCPVLGQLVSVDFRRDQRGMVCDVAGCTGLRSPRSCGEPCVAAINDAIYRLLSQVS